MFSVLYKERKQLDRSEGEKRLKRAKKERKKRQIQEKKLTGKKMGRIWGANKVNLPSCVRQTSGVKKKKNNGLKKKEDLT